MAHISEKVKVNMLLLWCGPDGEDIYEGFNLKVHQQYDLELIWSLFDKHCEPTCNFCAARWKFRTVAQAPSETLDTFYNRILKLAKQCQFKPVEEKSRLIDVIIYGTSITKAQAKLLQTPITLTLDQCLGICRHYESLKYHLETIKPKTVEYLQKRYNKSKGHGHGKGSNFQQNQGSGPKPGSSQGRGFTTGKSECSKCGKIHQGNTCPAQRATCYGCNKKGHFKTMCHSSRKISQLQSYTQTQPKVVQEVQAHGDQQNTGKAKNVNIVEMIRSMGLHEHQAKNSVNVQEMAIVVCDIKPVFHTPVQAQIVMAIWEQTDDLVMEFQSYVAISDEHSVFETKKINVIMVHDMELKSAHYSNVTINGEMVRIKQDTGAEVNVMSKSVFDRLNSSGNPKNSVLLNKTKMVKISGYGENSIEYMGTCVFKVSHNNHHRDVLFFITSVNDNKVILGAKTCQEFNLLKIICDDKCPCKTVEITLINEEFPAGLSLPDVKPKVIATN